MCLLCVSQSFHDRLKAEQDILETYDVEESCKYITVRAHGTGINQAMAFTGGWMGRLCVMQPGRHCSSAAQLA